MDPSPNRHPDDQTLILFALGKLGVRAHQSVAGHLKGCGGCRQRVAVVSSNRLGGDDGRGSAPGPWEGRSRREPGGESEAADRARPGASSLPTALPPGLADHPDYEV